MTVKTSQNSNQTLQRPTSLIIQIQQPMASLQQQTFQYVIFVLVVLLIQITICSMCVSSICIYKSCNSFS